MTYDDKTLKRDGSGITPVPQHFNPAANDYEPIHGRNNAGRVEIYGPDGNPIGTDNNKLSVRASEIETLLTTLNAKDFATQTTSAAILAKIIAAPATEAKQTLMNNYLDTILAKMLAAPATEAKQDTLIAKDFATQTTLAAILAKMLAAPSTEAKQTALNALIGEVQASPTANTMLARLKNLETKIDAITAGTTPATVALSGSTMDLFGATITDRPLAPNVPLGATFRAIDTQQKWQSDKVVWNNISTTEAKDWDIYGYQINESNFNPATAVTYIYNSVGKTPAIAGTGASASWNSTPLYSGIKPCMFKNGVVNYYLSPLDITKKVDGVTPSDITTGADGDVMIEFPKIWWKMNKVNAQLYAYLSTTKADSEFKALAHTIGSTVKNKIYIGVYPGVIVEGKLRSLSGVTPTASQTIGTFRTAAQLNGTGYQQFGYYHWLMIQHLFYLRFKNRDSQTALGKGYTNLDVIKNTGDTNAQSGLYYGTTSDQVSMKCFGLEALWDYQVTWTDGLFIDASRNILLSNQTTFNNTGDGYANLGQGANANLSGYIGTVQGETETGFIVKTTDGSETTKYADYGALFASCVAASGGTRAKGAGSGVGRLDAAYSASSVYASIGGRLVFIGTDNGLAT